MKKTLMVLTFALCATFVFAQTATPRMRSEFKAPTKAAQTQNNYQSSIFTKDVTPLFSCDFHADTTGYSTGVISGGLEGHGQSYDYATWRRWPDVSEQTLGTVMPNTYPYMYQSYFGPDDFVDYMLRFLDTSVSSANNGFMMMSLLDQQTWRTGNFNAFILFQGINTVGASVVDVQFYQYYRKYYDNCYVDYCTDGNTWNEVEINVRGVDVSVNSSLQGMVAYSLPVAAAGVNNLSVRIRYKSLNSSHDYGYFWMVDDFSVIPCESNRLHKFAQEYCEGNYGIIPQGMKINPAWYTHVLNNGSNPQTNVNAKLYHLNATQDEVTEIDAYNNGLIAVGEDKDVLVDRAGWLLPDSLVYRGWYGYWDGTPHGSGVDLPTNTIGDNYIFASLSNDSLTVNYDTMYYQVYGPYEGNKYRWAHDNGVLTYSPYNYFIFGFVNVNDTWFVSEDPERVEYYATGYSHTTRYTTDSQVPSDWVIHGVELVASPVRNYYNTGSKISAALYVDNYDGGTVRFNNVLTGANVKTITSSDVNDSLIIGRNSAGYLTLGNYNTIYIDFPEQPALEPNTSYRIGYAMEEPGYFALAQEAQGSYREASPTRPDRYDTIIYFANNEATAKYAQYFPVNQYQNFVTDYARSDDPSTFSSYNVEYNAMIRMIVGPRQDVVRHNIEVTCDSTDYGLASYGGMDVCGETITPAEGSTATITGETFEWCTADVIVDGVAVEPWDEDSETGDRNFRIFWDSTGHTYGYQYSFTNLEGDHSIHFNFHYGEEPQGPISIDPVAANVCMNLQPNPATSQVNLNITGVTGKVNCMLIDMSGRVVYNQEINAESANVINLSNLAKGAYFVRITNEQFSKVEKLIVR